MPSVSMERHRRDKLAAELAERLRTRGHVVEDVTKVGDVDRWRSAARHAGRLLGWSVRTGVSRGPDSTVVWVASDDYSTDPDQLDAAGRRLTEQLQPSIDEARRLRLVEDD